MSAAVDHGLGSDRLGPVPVVRVRVGDVARSGRGPAGPRYNIYNILHLRRPVLGLGVYATEAANCTRGLAGWLLERPLVCRKGGGRKTGLSRRCEGGSRSPPRTVAARSVSQSGRRHYICRGIPPNFRSMCEKKLFPRTKNFGTQFVWAPLTADNLSGARPRLYMGSGALSQRVLRPLRNPRGVKIVFAVFTANTLCAGRFGLTF